MSKVFKFRSYSSVCPHNISWSCLSFCVTLIYLNCNKNQRGASEWANLSEVNEARLTNFLSALSENNNFRTQKTSQKTFKGTIAFTDSRACRL